MGLYKGNKDQAAPAPEKPKSALFRSRAPEPVSREEQRPSQREEERFDALPVPPEGRRVAEGKVLGRPRTGEERPAHLPSYKETIVIGGDPKKEPPPPPPQQQNSPQTGDLDQTMVASQPSQPPPPPPPPAIDKEIIEQAEAEAEQIRQQAQMQAQQIVQEAMAQANQAAEEARQQAGQQGYQEGLQAGLEEGRQQGQAEMRQMLDALKVQFIEFVKLRRKVMVDMEPEIVRLAVEVAKRVVGEELKTNREVIVGIVRSSLATLQERDEILIRVNPAEYEIVKSHQQQFEAMIEGLKKFVVQPDGAIEAGSCAIETNLGNVDARIETQFEAIRQGLDEMCKIRHFERQEQLESTPVEVPGDPDFHHRLQQEQQAAPPADHGHGHGPPVEEEQEPQDRPQEMELLPEPTEELFATLTPEEQQQYMEAYQEQQEYLAQLEAQMMAGQEE